MRRSRPRWRRLPPSSGGSTVTGVLEKSNERGAPEGGGVGNHNPGRFVANTTKPARSRSRQCSCLARHESHESRESRNAEAEARQEAD